MEHTGSFAYAPPGAEVTLEPRPTPEETAVARAQRSVPASGMRRVTEDISDDDLYAAFVEFLGCYGIASEVAPGVIRLDIADDMYPTGREPGLPLVVHLCRAQLRRLAWADENIFDDREVSVPKTDKHAEIGFETLIFSLEETFESGLGDSAGVQPGHLVHRDVGGLRHTDDPPTLPS